jgi:Tol biopolymer transport system component
MSSAPPSIATVAPMLPPTLDRLVRTCLAKEPGERVQTAHDVKLQLEWIRDAGSQAGVPAPVVEKRKNRERTAWIAAGAATVVAVAALTMLVPRLLDRPAPPPLTRFSITPPEGVTMPGDVDASSISPDGRKLAFVAADTLGNYGIWIRSMDVLAVQMIAGTENGGLPFWSPDGKELGFFADGKLKKIALSGGTAEVICNALDARGGSWGADGTILFAPGAATALYRVSSDGGDPVEAASPDSSRHETGLRWPQFLPDGKHFLFLAMPPKQGVHEIYIGVLGSRDRSRLLSSATTPVPPPSNTA